MSLDQPFPLISRLLRLKAIINMHNLVADASAYGKLCVYVPSRQSSEHRLRFLKIIRVSKIDFTGAQSKRKRNKWCSEQREKM